MNSEVTPSIGCKPEVTMILPPELIPPAAALPVTDEPQPLTADAEVLVYIKAPADPAGVVTAFSSADDMDFDIVSTRS